MQRAQSSEPAAKLLRGALPLMTPSSSQDALNTLPWYAAAQPVSSNVIAASSVARRCKKAGAGDELTAEDNDKAILGDGRPSGCAAIFKN
ncbi:hypothetical protein HPB47_025168 [Ixodes persulcatus]|uniref:Uncharacterized protein n=1 Tax=Ixodes persulcatus TaxID=34615 RepID=A0AC60Q4K4_IXOPE|nr:hypothetical protein HPB47_025168 [Ixodes persulcatus]